MGLIFNRGCSGHHYKKIEETDEVEFDFIEEKICLVEKKVFKCEHDGCNKEKKEQTLKKRYNIYKIKKALKLLDDHHINYLRKKADQPPEYNIKKQHCMTIARQIDNNAYDDLEDLKNKLQKEAGEKL